MSNPSEDEAGRSSTARKKPPARKARKKAAAKAGTTPATAVLAHEGIPYALHSYHHDPDVGDYGLEAARELGVDPDRVFKTLVASVDGDLVVGVVPVDRKLDLKALAAAVGGKKAVMAEPATAERATGYHVGGISPIGQKTDLPIIIDDTAINFPSVLVSAGRRGLDLEIMPDLLINVLRARSAPIGRA